MRIVGFAEIIIDGAPLPPTLFEQWQRKSSGPTHAAGDAKLTIMCPSARRVVHRRTRSFAAVKGLSRHILARRAAVFHGPLDGCVLLRGEVVPITGNSADREGFRDREASVRRRTAARRGWRRERRWGSAPHPGLSGELFLYMFSESKWRDMYLRGTNVTK